MMRFCTTSATAVRVDGFTDSHAVRKSVAQIDGTSAEDLKSGLAEALARMGG
jgi:hypothetical protein